MQTKPHKPLAASELRRRAEARLKKSKKTPAARSGKTDMRRLLHELQVHQIELEMQNEELMQAREQEETVLHQYADLYDFAPVGYFTLDRDGTILQANLNGANLLNKERGQLLGRRFGFFVSESKRVALMDFLAKVFASESNETCEISLRKDGLDLHFVEIQAQVGANRQICHAIIADISKRVRAEKALRASENFLQSTLDALTAHIAILDGTGVILKVNHAWREFGRGNGLSLEDDGVGSNYIKICEACTGEDADEAFAAARAIRQVLALEIKHAQIEYPCHSPGDQRWFIAHFSKFSDEGKIHVVVAHEDISTRKLAEMELRRLSIHDALTGLYNRGFFEEEMARLERGRQFPVSIVMADVDGLKATNDREGHATGDALLKRVAQVLTAAFRAEDIVARFGGDEFAALLPDTDATAAEVALRRVRRILDEHNAMQSGTPLRLSFGVSTTEKRAPLTTLLKEADGKMYREKRGHDVS